MLLKKAPHGALRVFLSRTPQQWVSSISINGQSRELLLKMTGSTGDCWINRNSRKLARGFLIQTPR